jgi:hypothetical protein
MLSLAVQLISYTQGIWIQLNERIDGRSTLVNGLNSG